jgi:hypothetical protein
MRFLHIIEKGRLAGTAWSLAALNRALNPHQFRRPGSQDRRYEADPIPEYPR